MAAPDSLFTHKTPVKNKSGEEKRVLLTSSSASSAVLKDRFYIDFFVNFVSKEGTKVWAGACYVGSENYYMHNTARHGWIRCKEQSTGREYVVFWDAGLNTLGRNELMDVRSKSLNKGVEFDIDAYPAWFVNGEVWVRFRKSSSSNWSEWFKVVNTAEGKDLPNGIQKEYNRFWNLYDIFPDYGTGSTYSVQTKHLNTEGETLSNEKSVVIKPAAVKMKIGGSPADAYNSSTLYDVFPSEYPTQIGTIFYRDEDMQSPYTMGYFMEENSIGWDLTNINGVVTTQGTYQPYPNIGYDIWVVRNGTGSKVGEIQLGGSISAPITGPGGYTGQVSILVGTHDGAFGNFQTYRNFTIPDQYLASGDSIPLNDYSEIDESYDMFNWGYKVYVNAELLKEEWI